MLQNQDQDLLADLSIAICSSFETPCITLVVFVSKVVIIMVQVSTLTKERIDNKKKEPSEVKKENYYILLL